MLKDKKLSLFNEATNNGRIPCQTLLHIVEDLKGS